MTGFASFAAMARHINHRCHAHGLQAVSFQSQPRRSTRALKRREDGTCVVMVQGVARPDRMVAWDLAYGVAVANWLEPVPAFFVTVALASWALEAALPERTDEALRTAKVTDHELLHI